MDASLGVASQGPAKRVDYALSWLEEVALPSPEDLTGPTPTSSTLSLLHSRRPKDLSRDEVAALFVTPSGFDLLESLNWGPELRLAVE